MKVNNTKLAQNAYKSIDRRIRMQERSNCEKYLKNINIALAIVFKGTYSDDVENFRFDYSMIPSVSHG